MQIWGSVGHNVKIIGSFYISWDILDKWKGNLGQECVDKRFYLSRAKLEQFPYKNDSFPVLALFSTHPSLKSGVPTHTKLYFWDEHW